MLDLVLTLPSRPDDPTWTLQKPGHPTAVGRIDLPALTEALRRVPPGEESEALTGHLLWAQLTTPDLPPWLPDLLREGQARGQPLRLGVLARGASAGLPWELLAPPGRGALEVDARLQVLRLAPAPAQAPFPAMPLGWRDNHPALLPWLGAVDRGRPGLVAWPAGRDPTPPAEVLVLVGPSAEAEAQVDLAFQQGARGVVHAGALSPEALTAALKRFAAGLHRGEALAAAAVAARLAARDTGLPEPSWISWRVYLPSLGQADWAPAPAWPAGLPEPAPEAFPWLSAARRLASTQGFFGVEALLLTEAPLPGPWAARAAALGPVLARRLAGLRGSASGPPAWTPRLRQVVTQAGPGFGPSALLDRLVPPLAGLGLPLDPYDQDDSTLRTEAGAEGLPARALEVLLGPEDGRVLPISDRPIGRAAAGYPQGLYADGALTDPRLPRDAARWEGPGRLNLRLAVLLRRAGSLRRVGPGSIDLFVGDLLDFSPSTTLKAG